MHRITIAGDRLTWAKSLRGERVGSIDASRRVMPEASSLSDREYKTTCMHGKAEVAIFDSNPPPADSLPFQ